LSFNFLHVRAEAAILRNRQTVSDVCSRAKTLRVSANQQLAQHLGRFGNFDVIAFRTQSIQGVPKTRKNIQVRSGTDISFVRRKTKQRYRQLELVARRGSQTVPTLKPPRKSDAAIFKGNWLDAARRYAAVHERFGGAVNLGNGDLHAGLNRIEAGL